MISISASITPRPESIQLTDKTPVPSAISKISYVRDTSLAPEAYEIRIRRRHIVVRSSDEAGRFYGKTIAGWDDIAEYGLPSDHALVMWWQARHPGDLDRNVAAGYPTVICPKRPFYLDYCQETWHKYGFLSWIHRYNRLEYVYEYLDSLGIKYYDARNPDRHPEPVCPGI